MKVNNMIIPLPEYNEPESEKVQALGTDNEWVKWYMDCPPWVCRCGVTNFGRNKNCARWECKRPRPIEYVENEYEQ
jgi:hypothetical protein